MVHRIKPEDIYINRPIFYTVSKTYINFPYFEEDIFCRLFINELRVYRRKKYFRLYGFSIIYDHVNLLIQPSRGLDISKVMFSLKKQFSHNANRLMGINTWFLSSPVTEQALAPLSEGFTPTSISAPNGYLRHSISVAMYEGKPYAGYIEVTYWGDLIYLRELTYSMNYSLWQTPRAYSCQVGAGSKYAEAGVVWRDVDGIWGSYTEDMIEFTPAAKLIDRSGEWAVHFLMMGDYFHPSILLVYDDYKNHQNQVFGALVK